MGDWVIKTEEVLAHVLRDHDLILTPKLAIHVMDHTNPEYRPDVVDAITNQLRAKPRVRTGTFSASSWGLIDCQRARVFRFLGVREDKPGINERLASIFMDGHWRHLRWQAELLQANLIDAIEVPLQGMDGWLVGTADAMATASYGVEIKGINGFGFDRIDSGPKAEHVVQCQVYMAMSGLGAWSILYESKTTNQWREFVVEADPEFKSVLTDEVSMASKMILKRQLPPPIRVGSNRFESECGRCPWREKCRGVSSEHVGWDKVSTPLQPPAVASVAQKVIQPRRRP